MSGFFVLEFIGTAAFAVSGALVAIKHKMDLFGVAVLGLVTAVGGGVLRDIVISSTPPAVFKNPFAAATALAVSVAIFFFYYAVNRYAEKASARLCPEGTLPSGTVSVPAAAAGLSGESLIFYRRRGARRFGETPSSRAFAKNDTLKRYSETLLFLADTVGLAVFTVIGIRSAVAVYPDNYAVLIFVGVITGTGGGVIRDLLSVSIPVIFKKHIYAIASLSGAVVCALLMGMSHEVAMTAGAVTVIAIRICAAKFKWNLPVIKN